MTNETLQKMSKNFGAEFDINTLTYEDKRLYLEKRAELQKCIDEIYLLLPDSTMASELTSRFILEKNKDKILKGLTQIIGILSDLRTIVNCREEFPDLHSFNLEFYDIQDLFGSDLSQNILENDIKRFCARANSIRFYETKKRSWIVFIYIEKIFDSILTLFKI